MNRDLAKKRGLHLLAAAFAIFYVFVSLFPLLFSLLSSFKNNTTIYAAPFALPEALDLENYRYALGGTSLLRGMANSLLYSVLSIALIILMALLVSYAYRVRVPGYGWCSCSSSPAWRSRSTRCLSRWRRSSTS